MAIPNLEAARVLVASYEQAARIVYAITAVLNNGPTVTLDYTINGEPFQLTVDAAAVAGVWRGQLDATNAAIVAEGGDPVPQPPAPNPNP